MPTSVTAETLAVVGMSGGVDSTFAAREALREGYRVVGLTIRFMPEGVSEPQDSSVASAAEVASRLGIEHHVVDAADLFSSQVLDYVLDAYAAGSTPNPCTRCNEEVKFPVLLDFADRIGAEVVVTGHYARLSEDGGRTFVARGLDRQKDQSYFLYRLSSDITPRLYFPLGERTKEQVRSAVEEAGLCDQSHPESQDVCFVTGGAVADLVIAERPEAGRPGAILRDGERVGTHEGIARFTVGQRKGIGVGGGEPLFVERIDVEERAIEVAPHDALMTTSVVARRPVWYAESTDLECSAQVRYRMQPVPAHAVLSEDRIEVEFAEPVFAPAPGQALVLYDGDRVIGGGEISA